MISLERARMFLWNRALAYRRIFLTHGTDTDVVLSDLARFCRAHDSTFHIDHSASDRLDSRREVWLRIQHHLRLTDEELWRLYGNPTLPSEIIAQDKE